MLEISRADVLGDQLMNYPPEERFIKLPVPPYLELLGIEHRKQDLPQIKFDAMDSETPLNIMQRATMGWDSGLLTLNQALDLLNMPAAKDKEEGESRKDLNPTPAQTGDLPAENSQEGKPSED